MKSKKNDFSLPKLTVPSISDPASPKITHSSQLNIDSKSKSRKYLIARPVDQHKMEQSQINMLSIDKISKTEMKTSFIPNNSLSRDEPSIVDLGQRSTFCNLLYLWQFQQSKHHSILRIQPARKE